MPAVLRPAVAILAALLATGCGRDRLDVPDVEQPIVARTLAPKDFPREGLRMGLPLQWGFARGEAPLVAQATSGTAAIAVWRYPRTEALPRDAASMEAAQAELLRAVRQRDERYREISTRRTEVDGEPALELVGDQRVGGQPRRVRSTHVYAEGAEIVVDAYATERDFARLDAAVFRPFVRALRIGRPR
jgi:hypothetical protein